MIYEVGKVAVAGDWHGNLLWAKAQVRRMAELLSDEDTKLIFQLGDFGFWPGKWGKAYVDGLHEVLEETKSDLFFIDGNHENHALLKKVAKSKGVNGMSVMCPITDRIAWLQRGTRFKVNDRTWLALGGAASVDRMYRTENISWFPAERITPEQRDAAIAGGFADVLLCHDAPAGYHITFPHSNWPEQDLALSQVNRDYLQEVVEGCGIQYVMHGHMHMSHQVIMPKTGPKKIDVRVNCFNCDGEYGNWGILNAETMGWVDGA